MRIEYKTSTGNPFGQFVVFAENEDDRTILHNFSYGRTFKYKFWLHGMTYNGDGDGPIAFNFGWTKETDDKE